jgi:GntP family gluconate:H+ symporter
MNQSPVASYQLPPSRPPSVIGHRSSAIRHPSSISGILVAHCPAVLLIVTALGVAIVVLLITGLRWPAFLALAAGSFVVGLATRMPLGDIPRAFQQGVGDTLGFTAIVIGLGTVIGKLLAESGGAGVVSRALVSALGDRRLDWALLLSAFIIGLPVFFQVGLVLLAPVLFTLTRRTPARRGAGAPLLRLGIPVLAGLSSAHGLVPPHPGPLAAIERLGADTGRTLFYSLLVAFPIAVVAGPIFGRAISRRVAVQPGAVADQLTGARAAKREPSLAITLMTILLPVLLMLAGALAQAALPNTAAGRWLQFAGHPVVAMLIATVVSFYTFGTSCGFDRGRLLHFSEEALLPIAGVLLVVGAGGGFGRVLDTAGAGAAIAHALGGRDLPPLVLGWIIAAMLRLSVGSATVAVITAASILAPIASATAVNRDLLVVSIGAGSLIASHVNDGGFWLVKEYFNMSVGETLATWTLMETILSIAGLGGVLLLNALIG